MLEKNRAWCLEALLYHTQRFFEKYGFALPHAYQTTAYVGTKSFFWCCRNRSVVWLKKRCEKDVPLARERYRS